MTMKSFNLFLYNSKVEVIEGIRKCEKLKHTQQVAYRTYLEVITQVCFNCEIIRSTMP